MKNLITTYQLLSEATVRLNTIISIYHNNNIWMNVISTSYQLNYLHEY